MDNPTPSSPAYQTLQQQADHIAQTDTPTPVAATPAQQLAEPLLNGALLIQPKDSYHCDELLWMEGDGFIPLLYNALLHRQPSSLEVEQQQQALAHSSRLELLLTIAASDECRAVGVRLTGRRLGQWLFRNRNRRYIGSLIQRLLKVDNALAAWLPLPARQQRAAIAAGLYNQQQLVAELRQREQATQQQQASQLALLHAEVAYHARAAEIFRQQLQQRLETDLSDVPGTPELTSTCQLLGEHQQDKLDAYYIAFEDAFRGERELIRQRIERYLPLVAEAGSHSNQPVTVVDAGCGRGEWLQLIREQGWQGRGVDLNKVMVQECQSQGLDVTLSDVISYLRTLADSSLSAVTGFHIIEHLPFDVVFALFEESMRVLRPGGIILFETPNPENVLVGSHNFYHDVTHRNPVTPASVEFLARYHGFTARQIIRVNPGDAAQRLSDESEASRRLNHHLYGPQDYALLAAKPVAAGQE